MLILRWIINALVLVLVSKLIAGFHVDGFWAALIAALVLGLVNAIVRPLLLLLTLPVNVLTLGLFTFVINALMLLLVSSIVKGFTIDGFMPALWGAVLLAVISSLTNMFLNAGESGYKRK